ncbi:hypothetical protein ES319_A06G086100v1 [Gossypium barbadense]|uniref:Uncharacterized protein n=2 Tax=Gossypium TaxID=3633 RepID=A0A5J5VBM7_GOSBA|nr:hypothetical protein ES319_A06G086100v1 [Gossypium barbadense]TYH12817.1 hypothetical protein ES288_A06G095900v1 [Gossypium darwinii]
MAFLITGIRRVQLAIIMILPIHIPETAVKRSRSSEKNLLLIYFISKTEPFAFLPFQKSQTLLFLFHSDGLSRFFFSFNLKVPGNFSLFLF